MIMTTTFDDDSDCVTRNHCPESTSLTAEYCSVARAVIHY